MATALADFIIYFILISLSFFFFLHIREFYTQHPLASGKRERLSANLVKRWNHLLGETTRTGRISTQNLLYQETDWSDEYLVMISWQALEIHQPIRIDLLSSWHWEWVSPGSHCFSAISTRQISAICTANFIATSFNRSLCKSQRNWEKVVQETFS